MQNTRWDSVCTSCSNPLEQPALCSDHVKGADEASDTDSSSRGLFRLISRRRGYTAQVRDSPAGAAHSSGRSDAAAAAMPSAEDSELMAEGKSTEDLIAELRRTAEQVRTGPIIDLHTNPQHLRL